MHPLARKDEVTMRCGLHVVRLRPTLRAAITLERLHDGWPGLLVRVDQFSLETMQAIIRASAVDKSAAEAFLASFGTLPLAKVAVAVTAPLRELLALFFAPMQEPGEEIPTPSLSKPKLWSDVYAELFRYGTGWLGWTPADTWAATPVEIAQALEGKVAMLIAMNGGERTDEAKSSEYTPERLKEIEKLGFDPAFDRAALHKLRG